MNEQRQALYNALLADHLASLLIALAGDNLAAVELAEIEFRLFLNKLPSGFPVFQRHPIPLPTVLLAYKMAREETDPVVAARWRAVQTAAEATIEDEMARLMTPAPADAGKAVADA